MKNNRSKSQMATGYLSFMAISVALSIVLTRLFSIRIPFGGVEGIRIGFGSLPIIPAGVTLGPLAGGAVGAISDIVGMMLLPMGAPLPHFTLTSFLTGYLPGVMIHYLFAGQKKYWMLLVAIAVGQTITSLILVPYFLYSVVDMPQAAIIASMVPRIIAQVIQVPLYASFIKVLYNYRALLVLDAFRS